MSDKDCETAEVKAVCLLDVLGFEMRLKTLGLTGLKAKYDQLIEYVKQQRRAFDIVTTSEGHTAMGVMLGGKAYFSDSLLFWRSYAPPFFSGFTREIAEAVCVGLEIDLPLRGAIAVGEAIIDPDSGVFLGLPLVEVARIEKIQRWIGVSLGPSFSNARFSRYDPETVFPYRKHYKEQNGGKPVPREWMTGITVDWPRHWREGRESNLYDALNVFVTQSMVATTKLPKHSRRNRRRMITGF